MMADRLPLYKLLLTCNKKKMLFPQTVSPETVSRVVYPGTLYWPKCIVFSGDTQIMRALVFFYLFDKTLLWWAFHFDEDFRFYDEKGHGLQFHLEVIFWLLCQGNMLVYYNQLRGIPVTSSFWKILVKKSFFPKWQNVAKIVIWFCINKANFSLK